MAIGFSSSVFHPIAEHGFAIIADVISARHRADLLTVFENGALPRSRAGVRHALRNPIVQEFASHTSLLEIAQQCLGGSALPFRATLFDKSPRSNWLVVWHQDTALPLKYRADVAGWGPWSKKEGVIYAHAPASALERVVALRVHLDDSDGKDGPLRVLPGTHLRGVLSDDEIHELVGQITPMDCLVPRGGVLAMKPLLVHSSSKSNTSASRRVLHIEYAASANLEGGLELAVA